VYAVGSRWANVHIGQKSKAPAAATGGVGGGGSGALTIAEMQRPPVADGFAALEANATAIGGNQASALG